MVKYLVVLFIIHIFALIIRKEKYLIESICGESGATPIVWKRQYVARV